MKHIFLSPTKKNIIKEQSCNQRAAEKKGVEKSKFGHNHNVTLRSFPVHLQYLVVLWPGVVLCIPALWLTSAQTDSSQYRALRMLY